MTQKQIVTIIAVNALISAVISVVTVAVAWLLIQPRPIAGPATPVAASTATTPTAGGATPTVEVVIHTVQSGDTISGLAYQYDVSEEDIIAANQLENPNFLQVGMQLLIPVGGLPEATPTFTPAPTATDTPIPFEPPSADMTATAAAMSGATATALPTPPPASGERQIAIKEVIAAGDIAEERVVILNNGGQVADMAGWMLSDSEGNTYTFPNFRLWPAGSVTVYSRVGQDGSPPGNFYWGKLEAVWSLGEMVTLKDAEGMVVSTLVVGP